MGETIFISSFYIYTSADVFYVIINVHRFGDQNSIMCGIHNSPKMVLWKHGVKSGSSEFQVRLPFHTSATQYVARVGGMADDDSAIAIYLKCKYHNVMPILIISPLL